MQSIILGGAHIDRIGYAASEAGATSAPGRVERSFGGVAYNVACGLKTLGEDPLLVSRIGSDPDGRALLDDLTERSMETGAVLTVPGAATATYHAIINSDGTLLGAVAGMQIYKTLTRASLMPFTPQIERAGLVFVDANLPQETLQWIAGLNRAGKLVANTVSIAKAPRLLPILHRLDVLFTNCAEAHGLDGLSDQSAGDAAKSVEMLCEMGAASAIVSHGAEPVAVGRRGGEVCLVPVSAAAPVDETGAGDALVAGTLFGLLKGYGLAQAVHAGLAAARICIESAGSGLPYDRIGEIKTVLKR